MTKQTRQHWQSLLLALMATIFLIALSSLAFAQADTGAKFAARDPHVCKDRTQPKTGALSIQQAKDYFICDSEHALDDVYFLVEDVTVQVGPGRPYNPGEDFNFPNINVKYPVYPIRGSFMKYTCGSIYLDKSNLRKNCSTYDEPQAKGACYKDMFGDWHCGMADATTGHDVATNVAPPGGPIQPNKPADKKTPPKDQPKNGEQAGKNRKEDQKNAADQNAGDYPKPDFSDISDYYELVKYSYDPSGWLMLTVKLKKDTSPVTSNFSVHFLDEDGAEIAVGSNTHGEPALGGWGHAGNVIQTKVAVPYGRDLSKVKKVVFRP